MNLNTRKVKTRLKIKIDKCIGLLEKEYTSLNYSIYFYYNKEKLEKEQLDKPDMQVEQYEQVINGNNKIAGMTLGEHRKIKIFLFAFKDIEKEYEEAIHLVGNLYHEIRHAWQYENQLFQEEEILEIDRESDTIKYFELPSEKDAYKFQVMKIEEHGKKVLEIFGFNNPNIEIKLKKEIKNFIFSN